MKISREVFREKEGINSIFITRIYLSKIVHHSSKDPRNWTSSTRRRNLVCILVVRTFSLCRLDKQSIPRFFLFTRKKWTENITSYVFFFFFCILYKLDIDVDWDDSMLGQFGTLKGYIKMDLSSVHALLWYFRNGQFIYFLFFQFVISNCTFFGRREISIWNLWSS